MGQSSNIKNYVTPVSLPGDVVGYCMFKNTKYPENVAYVLDELCSPLLTEEERDVVANYQLRTEYGFDDDKMKTYEMLNKFNYKYYDAGFDLLYVSTKPIMNKVYEVVQGGKIPDDFSLRRQTNFKIRLILNGFHIKNLSNRVIIKTKA